MMEANCQTRETFGLYPERKRRSWFSEPKLAKLISGPRGCSILQHRRRIKGHPFGPHTVNRKDLHMVRTIIACFELASEVRLSNYVGGFRADHPSRSPHGDATLGKTRM